MAIDSISSATIQDEDGHLTNMDRDKSEVFNAFFSSVFDTDDRPKGSQCPKLEDHDYENDQIPINPEILQNLLLQLDPYKFIRPDGIHPRILEKLADVFSKPLLMISVQYWEPREVPADWKVVSIVPVFKKDKMENYGPDPPGQTVQHTPGLTGHMVGVSVFKHEMAIQSSLILMFGLGGQLYESR
ncbi:rna-directed dna polymerase from mobile element jockey-like [Pitangus sulphuratus]|nr:rna-directed dna polymerase from mobile element jockey-like [Pitangus sulphuratus]